VAGAATFDQMEANFDVRADRLITHIPAAELTAVSKSLKGIRLILLADADYMRRRS
jgi:hypothetical protein